MKNKPKLLILLFAVLFGNLYSNAQFKITLCGADESSFILSFAPNVLPARMFEGGAGHLKYYIDFGTPLSGEPEGEVNEEGTVFTNFHNLNGTLNASREITVNVPSNIYPNYYKNGSVTLTNTVNGCQETFSLQVDVLYPASIMVQKWNDVVALQNKEHNGGYIFYGYQWYNNGKIMADQTGSYIKAFETNVFVIYQDGNVKHKFFKEGDKFSVLLKRFDGTKVMSCPLVFVWRYNPSGTPVIH